MGPKTQTDTMPDLTGRSLDGGRYRLLESLGSGAYGKVYRAIDISRQLSSPKFYAIKCMNKPASGTHPELLQKREFSHHKRVSSHPNVVTFHRTWADRHQVYVVLDLCTGGDLFSAITERGVFYKNSKLIKNTFIQLISAVRYCHAMGVYHRDIKPENVLCSDDGSEIWLADFGLSTTKKISRDFGCGSSYYMSPECIGRPSSRGPDFREYSTPENDIWALGVILTNIITGRNPWRFATLEDDCFFAYINDRHFLRRVLPISSGVNNILRKIFTSHPSRRISLSSLKEDVFRLEAFYVDEEESLAAIKRPLAYYGSFRQNMPTRHDPGSGSMDSTPDSEEDYLFVGPDHDYIPLPKPATPSVGLHAKTTITEQPTLVASDDLNNKVSGPPRSTSSESAGPITPASHPVIDDPSVAIPDISGEGLGLPATFVGLQNIKITKQGGTAPQKFRRPADIIRSAVQRIKIISKVS